MNDTLKGHLKKTLPKSLIENLLLAVNLFNASRPISQRECNICEYIGYFKAYGRPLRVDARCPRCGSLERHRLLMLALEDDTSTFSSDDICVLHFAPEDILERKFRQKWANYHTADLFKPADLKLNIEAIELPSNSYDVAIVSHVLEHVDDTKAARELSRIIRPGGALLCMVPIIEGWNETYENPMVENSEQRLLHFGQEDHLRYFGRDFRERIERGGFTLVKEVTAEGAAVIKHGLLRGEKLFCFKVKDEK